MKRLSIPLIFASFAMVACSSGDNGGLVPAPVVPPPSGFTITSANAVTVSQVSWAASVQSSDLVGLFSSSGGFVANVPGTVSKVQGIASAPNSGGSVGQSVPIPPIDLPCVVGIVTVSGEIADPFTPTLTPGDFIDSLYTDCDEGTGEVINGLVRMTVDSFVGNLALGVYDLTATFVLTNLQVTTATDDLTSNGTVTVALDTTLLPAIAASVSGSSLTTDGNSASETLSNFQATQSVDAGLQPAPFTMDSSGTLDSSELAGVITYSTPVTFQGFDSDFPSSGEFLVVAETSSLRLIALDNINVRIEINNDGVIEIIDTTWAELTN
jgi:hypothetical protein